MSGAHGRKRIFQVYAIRFIAGYDSYVSLELHVEMNAISWLGLRKLVLYTDGFQLFSIYEYYTEGLLKPGFGGFTSTVSDSTRFGVRLTIGHLSSFLGHAVASCLEITLRQILPLTEHPVSVELHAF